MEMHELSESRASVYRLLSRIYFMEIDAALLDAMKGMSFPENGDAAFDEGCALLSGFLKTAGPDSLEELAVDYARVFLSAGAAQGKAAFPYESVYMSRRRLMMQESQTEAAQAYASKGLEVNCEKYTIPADHIAAELEFMAGLCAGELEPQREFFTAHLQGWVPGFCADAAKYAKTDFYKGAAKLTAAFIKLERGFLAGEKA